MGKMIDNLRWKPMWVSHLGCVKGCLDYLGLDVSIAWLFGATGHAFILNVHEVVCPSGPTAWNTEMIKKLGGNIGYSTEMIMAWKSDNDFKEKRKIAWEKTRMALDEGLPCYGWELDIPEFYVVYGYDDVGYYFSGAMCDSGKGPKAWDELGSSQIGLVEMYIIKPSTPSDDKRMVKDALDFALEHSKNPRKWMYPMYKAGLDGYDLWIKALELGKADGMGMAFNSAVWSECRNFAVKFLEEAKERINNNLVSLFNDAIKNYEIVAQNLNKVAETFPFFGRTPEHIKDQTRLETAIECLKAARSAEESGLKVLEQIALKL